MSLISDNILSVLVACFLVLIYLFIKRKLDYFSNRDFPYIKTSLLAQLKSVVKFNLSSGGLTQLYELERDKGNLCVGFFRSLASPCVLVLDPDLVESILIKDFSYFHDHGFNIDLKKDPLAKNLFNMKGDQWRTLRNKMLPTFTSGKLKGMIPAMHSCAQTLLEEMRQDASLRRDVNLKELFRKYTLAVFACCVFGIAPESIKDPDCEFRQFFHKASNPTKETLMFLSLFVTFPILTKILNLKFIPRDVEGFFLKLTKDALAQRKSSGMKRNDFVQLLLELKEKGSVEVDVKDLEEDEKNHVQQAKKPETHHSKLEITDELLSAQAFGFIVAGLDNTSYLAAITIYLLSKHKDLLKRVREEVKEALSKHGGMNYMALKDMKLLDASSNEALRLYPVLDALLRVCNKTLTLSNGVTIEKGMDILIPLKGFHMDSKYWSNPEKFDPDRFLDSDITPGTYMPFGDGPRICIAQRLALLIAKVIMAEIIVNFEPQPSSKTMEPLKPKLVINPNVEGGLWGSFDPLPQ